MRVLKRSKYLFSRIVFLTVLMFVLAAAPAGAATYGFTGISIPTNNNTAIGEAQLFVDVTDYDSDQVLFTFTNTSNQACSITGVYFDDGSLLGIAEIQSSLGVSFTKAFDSSVSPPELPGGSAVSPAFDTTQSFESLSADSDPPPFPNGVNNSEEWLDILFNLQENQTFDNVLSELSTGDLRIGIYVQAFNTGGPESFINNTVPVPITPSVLLFGSGLIGLAGFKRKIAK